MLFLMPFIVFGPCYDVLSFFYLFILYSLYNTVCGILVMVDMESMLWLYVREI